MPESPKLNHHPAVYSQDPECFNWGQSYFSCSFFLIKKNQKIKALNKFSRSSNPRFIKICKLVPRGLGVLKHTNFGHFASLRTTMKIFWCWFYVQAKVFSFAKRSYHFHSSLNPFTAKRCHSGGNFFRGRDTIHQVEENAYIKQCVFTCHSSHSIPESQMTYPHAPTVWRWGIE
jgi:hypothetical protein